MATVEVETDVVEAEDEIVDVEEDEVVELMEEDVLDVVEEDVADVIEDEVFDVDVVNDEEIDVDVEDVEVIDDEVAEVVVDEDVDVDVDEDVVVNGTEVAMVPVAMQLQALEILSDRSPALLDGQALTANVGMAVRATEVAVKVEQKDCAATRRPGV